MRCRKTKRTIDGTGSVLIHLKEAAQEKTGSRFTFRAVTVIEVPAEKSIETLGEGLQKRMPLTLVL